MKNTYLQKYSSNWTCSSKLPILILLLLSHIFYWNGNNTEKVYWKRKSLKIKITKGRPTRIEIPGKPMHCSYAKIERGRVEKNFSTLPYNLVQSLVLAHGSWISIQQKKMCSTISYHVVLLFKPLTFMKASVLESENCKMAWRPLCTRSQSINEIMGKTLWKL